MPTHDWLLILLPFFILWLSGAYSMKHNVQIEPTPLAAVGSNAGLGNGAKRRTEMTDDKLIAEVARLWVDGGGDAEGLDWCHTKLKEAVNAEIENRVIHEQAHEATRKLLADEAEIERLKLRVEKLRGALRTASGWCFSMTSDDAVDYDWLKRADCLLDLCGDMERPNVQIEPTPLAAVGGSVNPTV